MVEITAVKPQIWNFELVGGADAWKEVAYSGRVSGVPDVVKDEEIFNMITKNDYASALEHMIIKFDIKMSKGNAPELLEHRMTSHSGYSTRYIKVHEGIEKKEPAYEVIVPWDLLKLKDDDPIKQEFMKGVSQGVESYVKLLELGATTESSRYTLPFAQAVGTYHMTVNLRSMLNLLGLRLCVRTSPEFRCLAAQLYSVLIEKLPLARGLVGCRGFMKGVCPESNVTGVRTGEQHQHYPPCPFKTPGTEVFIPVQEEMGNIEKPFDRAKATDVQEGVFKKWAAWEG